MGADIVIATPGRLLSHIKLGTVDLSQVSFFVLDEADRMLDMGFYDDIMQVYKLLPATCQTIMFSCHNASQDPDTGPNDPEKPGRSQDSHLPSTRNNHANGLCLL